MGMEEHLVPFSLISCVRGCVCVCVYVCVFVCGDTDRYTGTKIIPRCGSFVRQGAESVSVTWLRDEGEMWSRVEAGSLQSDKRLKTDMSTSQPNLTTVLE